MRLSLVSFFGSGCLFQIWYARHSRFDLNKRIKKVDISKLQFKFGYVVFLGLPLDADPYLGQEKCWTKQLPSSMARPFQFP